MKKAIYFIILLPFIFALFAPIQDGDPALYAEVSREITLKNSFLNLTANQEVFFEKPPLFFWVQSILMKIFGANEFSARLHLFISLFLILFFIYRITYIFYDKEKGKLAVLLTLTTTAFFLMLLQPKIDLLLLCFLYGSLWAGMEFNIKKNYPFLLLWILFLSLGLLTKGPIGLLWPLFFLFIAFLLEFIEFKNFLILGFTSIISIIPFYLWLLHVTKYAGENAAFYLGIKQTFGRFFHKDFPKTGDPFLLFHSFLWAALPWIIIFIYILLKNFRKLDKRDIFFLLIIFLTLLISSFERWKMPQHSFPALIGAIIFTASNMNKEKHKTLFYIINSLLLLITFFITFLCFTTFFTVLLFLSQIILFIFILTKDKKLELTLLNTSLTFTVLTATFFTMIKYNAGVQIGKFLRNQKNTEVYSFNTIKFYSIPFYSRKFVKYVYNLKPIKHQKPDSLILIIYKRDTHRLRTLKKFYTFSIIGKFPHFYTSKPSFNFLLKFKRKNTLDTLIVYKLQKSL